MERQIESTKVNPVKRKGGKKLATYFVKLSNGHKGQAADKCDYINRNGKYKLETLRQELVAQEDFNLPSWAPNAKAFFEAADCYERNNGITFKQFIIMLPCELSIEENIKISRDIKDKIIGNHKAGTWAIHNKQAVTANVQNIHLHLMNSERIQDTALKEKSRELYFRRYNPSEPEKGGYQKDRKNDCRRKTKNPEIDKIRAKIAEAINAGYERNGFDIRVSGATLEKQKEEALKAGDEDRAEFFDRDPVKTISTKQWKKIQKIIEDDNIIDRTQPVPIIPSETNWPTFEKLISTDFSAAEVLLERVSLQVKKLKYQFKLTQKNAKKILEKVDELISGKEFREAIESIAFMVQNKSASNSAYINLYNKIYANKETQSLMINNIINRGRTKKYQQAKLDYQRAKAKKSTLAAVNRLDDKTQNRLELIMQASSKYMQKLVDEIKEINQTPIAKKRYDYIITRLKKSAVRARTQAIAKNNQNKDLKEILQELNKLIKLAKLNQDQKLPKELIKEITEKEYPDMTRLKKIIKELDEKSASYFPVKQKPVSPKMQEPQSKFKGKVNDYQR